jgi:hypothetical protein
VALVVLTVSVGLVFVPDSQVLLDLHYLLHPLSPPLNHLSAELVALVVVLSQEPCSQRQPVKLLKLWAALLNQANGIVSHVN